MNIYTLSFSASSTREFCANVPTYVNRYRQVSNIRRTKSQHLKDSHTVLGLTLPNPFKPDVENEDVVGAAPIGDAPTTSEWSTILLPSKVRLILEVLRYFQMIYVCVTSPSSGIHQHKTRQPVKHRGQFLWYTPSLSQISRSWYCWFAHPLLGKYNYKRVWSNEKQINLWIISLDYCFGDCYSDEHTFEEIITLLYGSHLQLKYAITYTLFSLGTEHPF